MICIQNVRFRKITEKSFHKMKLSNLKFFIVSRSGVIDNIGNIYFFTSDGAFVMDKNGCSKNFIEKFISTRNKWKKINLYFCDDLIIKPEIYNDFAKKLYATNIRDYWFETAIEIYKNQKQSNLHF